MNSRRRATASQEESKKANQAQREAEAEKRLAEKERQERTAECLSWREKHQELADRFRAQEDFKALRQSKAVRNHPLVSDRLFLRVYTWRTFVKMHFCLCVPQCQANIKSYFLCMTESNQRVRILKNQDGTPRNFTVRFNTNACCCWTKPTHEPLHIQFLSRVIWCLFRRETLCTSPLLSPVQRSLRGVHPGNSVATRGR